MIIVDVIIVDGDNTVIIVDVIIVEGGPTLNEHWVNVPYWLGCCTSEYYGKGTHAKTSIA